MARYINDGSGDAPKLRVYLNLDNLTDLRADTIWPGLQGEDRDTQLLKDGFEGIQLTTDDTPISTRLPYCGLNRINSPQEALEIAGRHADRGDLCLTVHAGWGIEDDVACFRLVEAILLASDARKLPIFVETHRATITQDIWRTAQLAERFPGLRFNGDFSHYYCGQELAYGDWQAKLTFMKPIFRGTAFLHGRIASPGSIQAPIGPDLDRIPEHAKGSANYLGHFKDLWTNAMLGFLSVADKGDVLVFAPELLPSMHFYARRFPDATGAAVEESDRYEQALLHMQLARSCFREAQEQFHESRTAKGVRICL